jgi:hypothetical protein
MPPSSYAGPYGRENPTSHIRLKFFSAERMMTVIF